MLAMGIWLILDDGSLMELLGNMDQVPGGLAQLAPVSYLLMAIGRALLIMGLLGCRGAVRENRCMAMTVSTAGPLHKGTQARRGEEVESPREGMAVMISSTPLCPEHSG